MSSIGAKKYSFYNSHTSGSAGSGEAPPTIFPLCSINQYPVFLEQVELATQDWVDGFNNRRLLSSIGDIPPAEYEENYYRQLPDTRAA